MMSPLFLSKSFLPGEMIMEILINLSIKKLTRLRVMSKNWNQSISDPAFQRWHQQKQCLTKAVPFFHRMVSMYPFSESALFILPQNENTLAQLRSPESVDFLYPMSIAGVVNGVVCYRYKILNEGVVVCLWNPVTNRETRLRSLEDYSHLAHSTISFGYDNVSFSFVVIFMFQKIVSGVKQNWMSVYHVNSNHLTSRILNEIKSESVGDKSINVGNHICWFGYKYDKNIGFPKWLISYDLIDGRIREYMLPPTRFKFEMSSLLPYENWVGLVRYEDVDEENVSVCLWTLSNLLNVSAKFEKFLSLGPIPADYGARLIMNNHIWFIRTSNFQDEDDVMHFCHGRAWNMDDGTIGAAFFHDLDIAFTFCFVGEFCGSLFSF